MDVTVEPKTRFEFVKKSYETLKPPMSVVVKISITRNRSMSNNNVDTTRFQDLEPEPADPSFHLSFRILKKPIGICTGASQSKNTDALVNNEIVIDTDAAFRCFFFVMIAFNVEKRFIGHGYDIFEVSVA